MTRRRLIVSLPLFMGAVSAEAHLHTQPTRKRPLIIAHRGTSGMRPEHTLAAYELAIDQGADYIEPDLVMTKDSVLIVRHENEISGTTNVGELKQFADRRSTGRTIDGSSVTGWFTEDFTLAEIKTLRARERLLAVRKESATYNDKYPILTFQEVLDLVKRKSAEKGRTIGVCPETKHPSYFRSIRLPMEKPLADILTKNGYTGKNAPVFIQSFEVANLKELRTLTDVPLVQLISTTGRPYDWELSGNKKTYGHMLTPQGLAEIATYAQGIGPEKYLVITRGDGNTIGKPTTLVEDAHKAGLKVNPWTFRSENIHLPSDLRKGEPGPEYIRSKGDFAAEYKLFFALGVDGLFTDFPADAIAAWESYKP